MREWALWLKVLLAALVLGVVALAAAVASLLLGLSLIAGGAVFAGLAAGLAVMAPFLIDALFPGGETSVGDPKQALNPPYAALPSKTARANPNLLLHPEYQAAPFRGRDREWGSLLDWCEAPQRSGLALISGPAGIGKTRLAAELCRSHADAGWLTGFLKADPSPAAIAGLARLRKPTLVIVDDAEGRVDQILRLLSLLLEKPPHRPWRIVLLARWKGDWWSHLYAKSEEVQAEPLVASVALYELGDTETSDNDRRKAFREAMASFGKILGIPTEQVRVPTLDPQWLNRPLFLQMATLSTICSQLVTGAAHLRHRPVTQERLLTDALEREREYWRATSAEYHVDLKDDGAGSARAVAVATLISAENEDEAEKALRAVPDLASQSEATRRLIARWLRRLYPDSPAAWFRPLRPDLLGEANVAFVLNETPILAVRLLVGVDGLRAKQALRVLARAATRYPNIRTTLESVVAADLGALWLPALETAEECGDPMGQILAAVIERDPRPDIVQQIQDRPSQSATQLPELRLVVTRVALAAARARDDSQAVAQLLHYLSQYQAQVGQLDSALASVIEAEGIYRTAAGKQPDVFLPQLAELLSNRSAYANMLGRREEELAAIVESVAIMRPLAAAEPERYLGRLATVLGNYSEALRSTGNLDDAMTSGEEAVAILRRLDAAGDGTHKRQLATALNNLSIRQAAAERYEDALATATEAVEIDKAIFAVGSDGIRMDLANALTTLSNRKGEVGACDAAIASAEEAVEIYRFCAMARPEAVTPDLAKALTTLANRQATYALQGPRITGSSLMRNSSRTRTQGVGSLTVSTFHHPNDPQLLQQALASITESVSIFHGLGPTWTYATRPNLAASLNNMAAIQLSLQLPEQAFRSTSEAVELHRQVVAMGPGSGEPSLAAALMNLSQIQIGRGYGDEARASSREAVSLYRELAMRSPYPFRSLLAEALAQLADHESELGQSEGAMAAISECVGVYRELESARPGEYQDSLSAAVESLAAIRDGHRTPVI